MEISLLIFYEKRQPLNRIPTMTRPDESVTMILCCPVSDIASLCPVWSQLSFPGNLNVDAGKLSRAKLVKSGFSPSRSSPLFS